MIGSRTLCGPLLVAFGFAAGWFGRDGGPTASGLNAAGAQDKSPPPARPAIPPNDG